MTARRALFKALMRFWDGFCGLIRFGHLHPIATCGFGSIQRGIGFMNEILGRPMAPIGAAK